MQYFLLAAQGLEHSFTQSFAERAVEFLLAVVDIEEETNFAHFADDVSCLLQDLQENATLAILIKISKLARKEAVQFLFKRVKQFCLLVILGEFVNIIVSELVGDVGTSPSEELVDVRCELIHQLLALSAVLQLQELLVELHNLNFE